MPPVNAAGVEEGLITSIQRWCSFLCFMKRYSFAPQRLVEASSATSLSKRIDAPTLDLLLHDTVKVMGLEIGPSQVVLASLKLAFDKRTDLLVFHW